jgi:hypothetical protein
LALATSFLVILWNLTEGNTFTKYEVKQITIDSWTVSSSFSGIR